jgi:microcystin-dependent protein
MAYSRAAIDLCNSLINHSKQKTEIMFVEPYLSNVTIFGGNFAPRGWMFCQGQLLAIAAYDALFALIGTTYGGDGQSTFALPDLRSRVAVHPGQGSGLSMYTLGQMGGVENVTLLSSNMPAHTHTVLTIAGNPGANNSAGTTDNPTNMYLLRQRLLLTITTAAIRVLRLVYLQARPLRQLQDPASPFRLFRLTWP